MYGVLRNSKIAINHHIDLAGAYANNMRLFEATGVGTMLLTDWKMNIGDMFESGKEVVTYRSPEECSELVSYYLSHEDERAAIARAGQSRTLSQHTYYHRMQELSELLANQLAKKHVAGRI
jgi:spore maturation protein CgeB